MNSALKFRDLGTGVRFEFDHSDVALCSGIAHGPWTKLSTRTYSDDAGNEHRIGAPSSRVRCAKDGCRAIAQGQVMP